MPRIGLRALQIRVSEILRNVLRQRSQHESANHALPVAVLTLVEEPPTTTSASDNENWDELTRLGEKIADGWPAGLTGAQVLSADRL